MDILSYLLGKKSAGGGGGGGGSSAKITPTLVQFQQNNNLTSLDLTNLDTRYLTTMSRMFYRSYYITDITFSDSFVATNVTDMTGMFQQVGASSFTEIDLSCLKNTVCSGFGNMFYMCGNLKRINLKNLSSSSNSVSAGYMFGNCSNLEFLDMRSFDFTKINSYGSMFDYVPANCEIIVKDQTQKDWFTTNFSFLTNVKTAAEYED